MKKSTLFIGKILLFCLLLLTYSLNVSAQRTYANSQDQGATGILCLNCTVANPANAADGNIETFSTLNVSVGVAATTYQDLIFPAAVASGTPVTVKLGTGDKLLSLTAVG